MDSIMERDSRNVISWGRNGDECQKRLYDMKVLVIGSDILAQYVLSGLAGLGIGHIHFMDNKRISTKDIDFLCRHNPENIGQKKVRHIEDTLRRINEGNKENISGIYSKFAEGMISPYTPDVVVDCTNNPVSKKSSLSYSFRRKKPLISGSADNWKSAACLYLPNKSDRLLNEPGIVQSISSLESVLMKEYEGKTQGGFASGIMGGIICEEIRKFTFRYENSCNDDNLPNTKVISYNLYSENRKDTWPENARKNLALPIYFKNKSALVAGAGGIGNFVALSLALLGVGRIDIIDFDTVQEHNLNRQVMLYGSAGRRKAIVLSERIKEIDPYIRTNPTIGKIGELNIDRDASWVRELYSIEKKLWARTKESGNGRFIDYKDFLFREFGLGRDDYGIELMTEQRLASGNYDVIFGCLDNKYARLWLDSFSSAHNIPYIDGGTDSRNGRAAVYVPGKTKRLNEQLDLMYLPPRRSCAEGPEGSVVMSNMVIGSAMVGESIPILYGQDNILQSIFRYDALSQQRFVLEKY